MTQVVRNSGFQSGTVSVSYFKRLSDKLWDYEALLLALLPLFNFGNKQQQKKKKPPRPWFTLSRESPGLAGNVTLNTGPPVKDYFCSRRCRQLPAVIRLYLNRSMANLGQNHHLHGKRINQPKCLHGTKQKSVLSLFLKPSHCLPNRP